MKKSLVNSHNEWDPLEEVIVGNTWDVNLDILEKSYRIFYNRHISSTLPEINSQSEHLSVKIKKQYLIEHIEDINKFTDLLKSHGIIVKRPYSADKIINVETPFWKGFTTLSGPLNARDLTLIIGNKIIECPIEIRGRYFETDYMKHLFYEYFKSGAEWICAPKPLMIESSFDENLKHRYSCGLEMMFDGARCMRMGTDIVVSVNNKNNKLGLQWLKQVVGNKYTFHKFDNQECYGHIDADFVPLKPGLILVNNRTVKGDIKNIIPKKFRNWDLVELYFDESSNGINYEPDTIFLASKGIDLNVLSINEQQLICGEHYQKQLQKKVKPYGIECIPCPMRHSRIFDGSFHCLTLDIRRTGELQTYD